MPESSPDNTAQNSDPTVTPPPLEGVADHLLPESGDGHRDSTSDGIELGAYPATPPPFSTPPVAPPVTPATPPLVPLVAPTIPFQLNTDLGAFVVQVVTTAVTAKLRDSWEIVDHARHLGAYDFEGSDADIANKWLKKVTKEFELMRLADADKVDNVHGLLQDILAYEKVKYNRFKQGLHQVDQAVDHWNTHILRKEEELQDLWDDDESSQETEQAAEPTVQKSATNPESTIRSATAPSNRTAVAPAEFSAPADFTAPANFFAPADPPAATPTTAEIKPETRVQVTAEFSAPADFAAAPAAKFSALANSPTTTPSTAENPAKAEPPVAHEEAEIQAGNLAVQAAENRDSNSCPQPAFPAAVQKSQPAETHTAEPEFAVPKSAAPESAEPTLANTAAEIAQTADRMAEYNMQAVVTKPAQKPEIFTKKILEPAPKQDQQPTKAGRSMPTPLQQAENRMPRPVGQTAPEQPAKKQQQVDQAVDHWNTHILRKEEELQDLWDDDESSQETEQAAEPTVQKSATNPESTIRSATAPSNRTAVAPAEFSAPADFTAPANFFAPADPPAATPTTAEIKPETRVQVTAEFSAPADFAAAPAAKFSALANSPTTTPSTAENPAKAEPPVAHEEAEIQAGNLAVQAAENRDSNSCPQPAFPAAVQKSQPAETHTAEPEFAVPKSAAPESAEPTLANTAAEIAQTADRMAEYNMQAVVTKPAQKPEIFTKKILEPAPKQDQQPTKAGRSMPTPLQQAENRMPRPVGQTAPEQPAKKQQVGQMASSLSKLEPWKKNCQKATGANQTVDLPKSSAVICPNRQERQMLICPKQPSKQSPRQQLHQI
ncbi:protein piccolo-like [Manihot esculenta]|uniref:protein piccolo-like n=1 Tax=Manihot esculenta TaxID=3983 RepID=UPI001CC7EAE9|nr:protein piccolo-like [Manihot esculenta]